MALLLKKVSVIRKCKRFLILKKFKIFKYVNCEDYGLITMFLCVWMDYFLLYSRTLSFFFYFRFDKWDILLDFINYHYLYHHSKDKRILCYFLIGRTYFAFVFLYFFHDKPESISHNFFFKSKISRRFGLIYSNFDYIFILFFLSEKVFMIYYDIIFY